MSSDEPATRQCPKCERYTDQPACPEDGTQTLIVGVRPVDPSEITPAYRVAGRYRVVSTLARGGFATVFDGVDESTGQPVAIKIPRAPEEEDRRLLLRFFQEARVLATLEHPCTVRVLDVGQDDSGVVFLVMERLVGRSLTSVLAERRRAGGALSESEAAAIACAVLSSLAEAHGSGLVHRDVKPDNIVLLDGAAASPAVKLIDFGVAKVLDITLTGASPAPCTPAYASPEQALGGAVDPRTDLYAVGVLLFHLVTGNKPFEGNSPTAILYMQVHKDPPDLREQPGLHLSDAFVQVVECALRKQPEDRFASAAHMHTALLPCLDADGDAPTEEVMTAVDATIDEIGATDEVTAPLGPTAGEIEAPGARTAARRSLPPPPGQTSQSARTPPGRPTGAPAVVAAEPSVASLSIDGPLRWWFALLGLIAVGVATAVFFGYRADVPVRPLAEPQAGPPRLEAKARPTPANGEPETNDRPAGDREPALSPGDPGPADPRAKDRSPAPPRPGDRSKTPDPPLRPPDREGVEPAPASPLDIEI